MRFTTFKTVCRRRQGQAQGGGSAQKSPTVALTGHASVAEMVARAAQ